MPEDALAVRTVLECWAPWCGASRRMALALAALSAEGEPQLAFRRTNTDDAPEALGEYRLRVLPTLLFLDAQNQEITRIEGACGGHEIQAALAARLG